MDYELFSNTNYDKRDFHKIFMSMKLCADIKEIKKIIWRTPTSTGSSYKNPTHKDGALCRLLCLYNVCAK